MFDFKQNSFSKEFLKSLKKRKNLMDQNNLSKLSLHLHIYTLRLEPALLMTCSFSLLTSAVEKKNDIVHSRNDCIILAGTKIKGA